MTFPCSQPQNLAFFPILAPDPGGFFLSGSGCGLGSFLAESVKKGNGKIGGSGNRAVVSGRTNAGGNFGGFGVFVWGFTAWPRQQEASGPYGVPMGWHGPEAALTQPESYPVSHPVSYRYPISYLVSQSPHKLVTL